MTALGGRTIEAARAATPPVIDGKLDDACWQKAIPATDFLSINSDRPATYQSIGYVCYDDSHLYVGMKCLMPEGGVPVGKAKPHDTYVFGDDIVEIMVDPGRTQARYYQLVLSAYGATYDSARGGAGGRNDPSWNGDWHGAAHIGEGYWSAEMAIPYHALGISPGMGPLWGINLCREAKAPRDEYSSNAARGAFNSASDFAVLKGLDVDFSRYFFTIGPAVTRLEFAGDQPRALFDVPVKNTTGRAKNVKVERVCATADGTETAESKIVDLPPLAETALPAETLEVEPLLAGRTDGYILRSAPVTKKVVVSDAADGAILAVSQIGRPRFIEPIRLEVKDPWQRETSPDKSTSVSLKVLTRLSEAQRKDGRLVVTLTSRETGELLASRTVSAATDSTAVTFSATDLPWGAYDARAVFQDAGGREIVSTHALATVLPGGKQRVKVLNNMVSELMNAQERGLLGERELAFMNPRDGWVFVVVSGNAKATVDAEQTPLAAVRDGGRHAEAMRLLSAGRHVVRIEGQPDQVIVRAIPELMYSCYPGGFACTWDWLKKEVLPHCNVILGSTGDEAAMREWAALGKKWVTFASAPGHSVMGQTYTVATAEAAEAFVPAEQCYEILTAHEGFRHPLANGMMVDMIGGASIAQKIEIARAISRIASDPKFKGKAFQPWYEGTVFGSEGDQAFMKVVLEAGWPFSYYMYLVEQTSAEQTATNIQNSIVRLFQGGDEQIPGAMRRSIVTLGYWSDMTSGQVQDIDPATNFKVLMQMQFEALANDPKLFGVYGAFWYYSPYVDEETLRWSAWLHRHYGIEGKTTTLTTDPYRSGLITNADFEQGTDGWTIHEAEPGCVTSKTLPGYGSLQGRYLGGSRGDAFLVTKRSDKGPNSFSQEIRNLTPGRTYSFKMISANYGNLIEEKSVKQPDAVSIALENADLVDGPDKNAPKTYENHYAHELGKFKGDYHAYMNYHWYLFRPKGPTTRLTVSDWVAPGNPGGPVGEQILYNFIEIEPYFEQGR